MPTWPQRYTRRTTSSRRRKRTSHPAPRIPRLLAHIAALEARLEEREADIHARIRAGYDQTVADCWRAKVAELEAENERLRRIEARVAKLRRCPDSPTSIHLVLDALEDPR